MTPAIDTDRKTTLFAHMDSPIGSLLIVETPEGITDIAFEQGSAALAPAADWREAERLPSGALEQLRAYFAGERRHFELPLAPSGTPFQRQVWSALQDIPYGATTSYARIAEALGRSGAVRAVGAANGRNPLPIVIPCHRVLGSDGSLTGFSGGVERKAALLALEARHANPLGL